MKKKLISGTSHHKMGNGRKLCTHIGSQRETRKALTLFKTPTFHGREGGVGDTNLWGQSSFKTIKL